MPSLRASQLTAQVTVTAPFGEAEDLDIAYRRRLHATEKDILAAEALLPTMPEDRARRILSQIRKMHKHDQNFDLATLEQITEFLDDPDVREHPDKHAELILAMRVEAILCTENSPYAMVRGSVDTTDDMSIPALTSRVWIIGILSCCLGSFVNQLFTIRFPSIGIPSSVIQLITYPFGVFLAKVLPDWGFTFRGKRYTLNPGPFNRKEHMCVVIMANVGMGSPYMSDIVFVAALPQWFNRDYARKYGYQITNTLATSFLGFGLAGLARRFLVWPSYCVWPDELGTLALNKGFHNDEGTPIPGPGKKIYTSTRMRLFYITFVCMFFYFWLPNTFAGFLTYFNWIAWIAPNNIDLANITSIRSGLGINPWPTFDWNYGFALTTPTFSVVSQFVGMFLSGMVIIAFYYTNAYNTSYLPMMSNKTFDNRGKSYDVKKIINENSLFDMAKYQKYSEPWMAASNLVNYLFFFAKYTAVLTYAPLYHWHELKIAYAGTFTQAKNFILRRKDVKEVDPDAIGEDVHYRLMRKYPEAPDWWYFFVFCASIVLGVVGVEAYPTGTSGAVVVYGTIFALIFVIPVGVVSAVAETEVTLNVLAEFIGGMMSGGNALSMNFFKMYGYVTTAKSLAFVRDLKLGHYAKVPPRASFIVQCVGSLICAFVTTAVLNWQMSFEGVCTDEPKFRFYCYGEWTFYTASVFWGTLGPARVFGKGSHYWTLLLGFPLGLVLVLGVWGLQRIWPKSRLLRSIHVVAITTGAYWFPDTLGMKWTFVVTTLLSWNWLKSRYLAFWSRYNYVFATAMTAGVSISAIVQFLAFTFTDVEFNWWGNDADKGCAAPNKCKRFQIPKDPGYFGGAPGTYH